MRVPGLPAFPSDNNEPPAVCIISAFVVAAVNLDIFKTGRCQEPPVIVVKKDSVDDIVLTAALSLFGMIQIQNVYGLESIVVLLDEYTGEIVLVDHDFDRRQR